MSLPEGSYLTRNVHIDEVQLAWAATHYSRDNMTWVSFRPGVIITQDHISNWRSCGVKTIRVRVPQDTPSEWGEVAY